MRRAEGSVRSGGFQLDFRVRRFVTILFVLAAAGASGLWLTGRGSHTLTPPAGTVSAPADSDSYVYLGGEDNHSASYLWPVLGTYLSDVPTGARVLDLGSGSGDLLASFGNRQWDRVGVDISRTGVEIARRTHSGITFFEGDATGDLTGLVGASTFDVVVSTETLEHVMLPRRFLHNAFLVLKPGGRLVLSVPYHGYLKNLAIALGGDSDQHFDSLTDWGHIKFYSVASLSTLLWEAGFERLEYQGAGRFPYLWKSMVFVGWKPTTRQGLTPSGSSAAATPAAAARPR